MIRSQRRQKVMVSVAGDGGVDFRGYKNAHK